MTERVSGLMEFIDTSVYVWLWAYVHGACVVPCVHTCVSVHTWRAFLHPAQGRVERSMERGMIPLLELVTGALPTLTSCRRNREPFQPKKASAALESLNNHPLLHLTCKAGIVRAGPPDPIPLHSSQLQPSKWLLTRCSRSGYFT